MSNRSLQSFSPTDHNLTESFPSAKFRTRCVFCSVYWVDGNPAGWPVGCYTTNFPRLFIVKDVCCIRFWPIHGGGFVYFSFYYLHGCFLKWWVSPISTPKCWSFLVGKAMVVGETHQFRKPPHVSLTFLWLMCIGLNIIQYVPFCPSWVCHI